jgi:hypothetical protein
MAQSKAAADLRITMGDLVDVSEAGPGRFEPEPDDRRNWRFGSGGDLTSAPFRLRDSDIGGHLVIAGQSGSGKTETLKSLIFQTAAYWGWRVIVIDGKNDAELAGALSKMAATLGRKYREFPRDGYNFWGGSRTDRVVRLVDLLSPQAAVDALEARHELSRAVENFVAEVQSTDLFVQAIAKAAQTGGDAVKRLNQRYVEVFGALYDALDGEWKVNTVDMCYFGLDAMTDPTVAGVLTLPLLRDIAQTFASSAADRKRRTLLVFDEFSALPVQFATDLVERVRSYNVDVVLGVQSYAGLGQHANRLLEASNSWILHRAAAPEPFVALLAGSPSERRRRSNAVRQLKSGQVMWARGGASAVLTVNRWENVVARVRESEDETDREVARTIAKASEAKPDLESVREKLRKSREARPQPVGRHLGSRQVNPGS